MRKEMLFVAVSVAAMATSGCTSLDGTPRRVVPVSDTLAIAKRYPIDDALKAYENSSDVARGGLSRRQYRDMVVRIYMNAADGRYGEFRAALSGEARGAGLGFDLAVLGLTSGASVARRGIVNELSAVAAAFSGARIAVDKNLYFEKALPALLAAMDAGRVRVKTDIATNLQKPETDYPLQVAFGQIADYELAASLDRAVEAVIGAASDDRAVAEAEFQSVTRSCDSKEDRADAVHRITQFAGTLATANKTRELAELAALMGLDETGTVAELRGKIRRELLGGYCTNAKLNALVARIQAESWGGSI